MKTQEKSKVEEIRGYIAALAQLAGFSVTDVLSSDLSPLESIVGTVEPSKVAVKDDDVNLLDFGLFMLGWDEEDDRDKLMDQFGKHNILDMNGKVLDPSVWAWCGGFADLLLRMAGLEPVGSNTAKDFWDPDKSVNTPVAGRTFACCRNHISVFAGYADPKALAALPKPFKVRSVDEWDSVRMEDDGDGEAMVLGGNQSDEVNISPLRFYEQYSKFLGYCRVV